MQRSRWIALQGSSRGLLPPLLLFAVLISQSGLPAHAADDQAACRSAVARIVSIQGTLERLPVGQNDWSKITRLDTPLCEGDRLRTGAFSRAALFIQPETLVRVDQNTTISVSQSDEETLVEFTQGDIVPASTAAHTCGAGYFITRFPRKFRVNTPHLNAAVEGTEFLVAMRCEATDLSVFEGKVLAAGTGTSEFPPQNLVSGQTLTAGGSAPPAIKLMLKPADAVQWTLYYPPITPAGPVQVEDCSAVAPDNRSSCLIARAERLLRAGRVDEAQANIGDALAIAPDSSDAKALSSIISLVRNDKADALRLAKETVDAAPGSARAWLALSYAQQADFKLEAALVSAQRAAGLTPSSALALARVAELQLSLGWTREAEKTAKQAVAANPAESRAHMILGFVHLAQLNVKAAREDFGRAIERDSTEPLSRLGLGLAIIREGKLIEGREQIEIAVALDPTNSLIRSYVGKAYYEENSRERDELASVQFEAAKRLDPNDPTPWFYDAIAKEASNRPVEALRNIEKSIELNDSRAIYRSRLLLDEDAAARQATLARMYWDLGFQQLALNEGWTSLNADPGNYSAHRMLADSYSAYSNYEVAGVSELLQAQLLQPLNLNPIRPGMAESDLAVLQRVGPFAPTFNDFTSLFERNRASVQLNAVAGSNDTLGEDLVASGVWNNLSVALGQSTFRTDGFRTNDDYHNTIYDGLIQVQLTENTNAQVEIRTRHLDEGDISMRLAAPDPNPADRRTLDTDTVRFGFHHVFSPGSELIGSWISQDRTETQHVQRVLEDPFFGTLTFNIDGERDDQASTTEAEYIGRWNHVQLVTGAGYSDSSGTLSQTSEIVPLVPPGTTFQNLDVTQQNGWAYLYLNPVSPLSITMGVSANDYHRVDLERRQVNSKLGLTWTALSGTTLRAAAFRVLKKELVTDQTIEPTQVAGFNQFYDDPNATDSTLVGIAVDQRFGPGLQAGLQFARRFLTGPLDLPTNMVDYTENLPRAYLYWTPSSRVALGVDYQLFQFARDTMPLDATFPKKLSSGQTQLSISWFPTERFIAKLRATYVDQTAEFPDSTSGGTSTIGSYFSLVDVSLGYWLPRRMGQVTFGVTNLFDRHFDFQDLNFLISSPRLAPFVPDRQVFARVNLYF
jgi:Tfp pilus assembly protein PilF